MSQSNAVLRSQPTPVNSLPCSATDLALIIRFLLAHGLERSDRDVNG